MLIPYVKYAFLLYINIEKIFLKKEIAICMAINMNAQVHMHKNEIITITAIETTIEHLACSRV
jgi:hypothetical protein